MRRLRKTVQPRRRANSFKEDYAALDSGEEAEGILEVMPEGFGFIRCDNYMPGDHDIYVAPAQIRRFNLKTGDIIKGNMKVKSEREKFQALLYLTTVNGYTPDVALKRTSLRILCLYSRMRDCVSRDPEQVLR